MPAGLSAFASLVESRFPHLPVHFESFAHRSAEAQLFAQFKFPGDGLVAIHVNGAQVIQQAPALPDPAQRAEAVAAARTAALQDEGGKALDAALRAHGAPARPLREQPIHWVRKPGTRQSTTASAR